VAASRVAGNYHYVSDVVAGAALGYVIGRTVTHRRPVDQETPRYLISPMASPAGSGVGISLAVQF